MTKLTLSPEAAAARAARKAAKAAAVIPAPPIAQPEPTVQVVAALPNKHGRLKAELDALEAKLRRIWQHCFTAPVPLAVGIRYDIAKHLSADEQKLLPGVLHRWVKRNSYLRACVQPGAHRVGLDGTLTPISEKEVTYAREKLAAVVSERATERPVTP